MKELCNMAIPLRTNGTGESWCQSSTQIRLELANTPITHAEMLQFRDYLLSLPHMANLPKMNIYFGKPTTRTMGTAYLDGNEILIHRHCVEVFLHEIAHFITCFVYKDKEAHGYTFGQQLDYCIATWLSNTWKGV